MVTHAQTSFVSESPGWLSETQSVGYPQITDSLLGQERNPIICISNKLGTTRLELCYLLVSQPSNDSVIFCLMCVHDW